MNSIKTLLTAVALTAATHGADAQSAPKTDPDAKLKGCVAEALDIVLPTAKPTSQTYEQGFPPTHKFFYHLQHGDQRESGTVIIALGKSGPSTLNIKVDIGPARDQYRATKLQNAFTDLAADKGNVFKKASQVPTAVGDEGRKYLSFVGTRASDILTEIRACMTPEQPKIG